MSIWLIMHNAYLLSKVPTWYRRIVSDTKIPTKTLKRIEDLISKQKTSKEEIKNLLRQIQKENAADNKKLWDYYLEETLSHRYKDLKLSIAQKSAFTAVIVETRKHPHFKVVVQNTIKNLEHLNPRLNIYHGTENEEFVKDELKNYCNINFINLNVSNLDLEGYNKIILSKEFWEQIPSSKVLVFQTDAITFKPLNPLFINFDYIGAPWKKNVRKKNNVNVGNGGLSIRSREMMLSIIEQDIPRITNIPEDVYLCKIIKKQKYKLASLNEALNFSTENIFNPNAFGCHKIWEETTTEQLKEILK